MALWDRSPRRELAIHVFGMVCEHCEATVEAVLEDVEGVRSATAELSANRARVEAEASVEPVALVEAARSVGYEARPGSQGAEPA